MSVMVTRVCHAAEVQLSYAEGSDAGPPAVLLHGVVRRWQDFEPIIPALAQKCRLYGLDFRGHGLSARTPGAYRVADYVGDAVTFLDATVGEPAVLIGHSLGGMVAVAVAAERPNLVRAIVLEDPPFEMMGRRIAETSYLGLFQAYRALVASNHAEDALAAALAEVRVAVPPSGSSVRFGDGRSLGVLQWLAHCLRSTDPDVLTPVIAGEWLDGLDVDRLLPRVACPGLFVQADDSAGGVLPDDYAAKLAARLPQVRHVRLAGVGHHIHASQPDVMVSLTLEFLESLA